jgi:hypothetical protein
MFCTPTVDPLFNGQNAQPTSNLFSRERRAMQLVVAQPASATSFNVEAPPSHRHLVS